MLLQKWLRRWRSERVVVISPNRMPARIAVIIRGSGLLVVYERPLTVKSCVSSSYHENTLQPFFQPYLQLKHLPRQLPRKASSRLRFTVLPFPVIAASLVHSSTLRANSQPCFSRHQPCDPPPKSSPARSFIPTIPYLQQHHLRPRAYQSIIKRQR